MSMTIAEYMNLPYSYNLIREESGIWFIQVVELEGCMSQGDSIEEAFENIKDAMRGWIKCVLEEDETVPLPFELRDTIGSSETFFLSELCQHDLRVLSRKLGLSKDQIIEVLVSQKVEKLRKHK